MHPRVGGAPGFRGRRATRPAPKSPSADLLSGVPVSVLGGLLRAERANVALTSAGSGSTLDVHAPHALRRRSTSNIDDHRQEALPERLRERRRRGRRARRRGAPPQLVRRARLPRAPRSPSAVSSSPPPPASAGASASAGAAAASGSSDKVRVRRLVRLRRLRPRMNPKVAEPIQGRPCPTYTDRKSRLLSTHRSTVRTFRGPAPVALDRRVRRRVPQKT